MRVELSVGCEIDHYLNANDNFAIEDYACLLNLMGFGEFLATEYSPLILWRSICNRTFSWGSKVSLEHCRIQATEYSPLILWRSICNRQNHFH